LIAQLTGTVAHATAPFVVLDVNGVGYKVAVPLSTLERLPLPGSEEKVTLLTHMLVREDDLSLYGFFDDLERRVFELLLTVQGVGPKVALALLSALGGAGLAQTVGAEDVRGLSKVPGIGAKTAQRLVLDLKDKLFALGFERKVEGLAATGKVIAKSSNAQLLEDVISALMNLGYNKVEAQKAADAALDDALKTEPSPQFPIVLRAALNRLTK
jgi:holliday junction DNA helicase RuvA